MAVIAKYVTGEPSESALSPSVIGEFARDLTQPEATGSLTA